jgi:hypothetical protein
VRVVLFGSAAGRRLRLVDVMIDRLTVLRAERANAADVLRRLQDNAAHGRDGAGGRQDPIDSLTHTIDRLDRAIAQWDAATLRIA